MEVLSYVVSRARVMPWVIALENPGARALGEGRLSLWLIGRMGPGSETSGMQEVDFI